MIDKYYKMTDVIFEFNSYLAFGFTMDLLQESGSSYYSEFQTSRKSDIDVMIKRKLNYYFTLDYRDHAAKKTANIIITNEMISKFMQSIEYTDRVINGNTNSVFVSENGVTRTVNNLPIVSDEYPGNKIFRIYPSVYYSEEDPVGTPAANIIIGTVDCVSTVLGNKIAAFNYMMRTFNAPMYGASMLSALGIPEDTDKYRISFKQKDLNTQESYSKPLKGRMIPKKNTFFEDNNND